MTNLDPYGTVPKTVYLDLDGVLVDFIGGALAALGVPDAARHELTHWNSMDEQAERHGLCPPGQGNAHVWSTIDDLGADFWAGLDTLPYGNVLLTHLLACNVDLCFVTAPSRHHDSAAGKVMWLKNNLSNEVYRNKPLHRRFALCPTKHLLAAPTKLLVDDRDRNCRLFRKAGGQTVLWPQPWNSATYTKREAIDHVCDALGIRRPRRHDRSDPNPSTNTPETP